jgi:hypothetical protein
MKPHSAFDSSHTSTEANAQTDAARDFGELPRS